MRRTVLNLSYLALVALAFVLVGAIEAKDTESEELFVLTISVCESGFCNDFDIDHNLTWSDCMHAVDIKLETEPNLIWACVPVDVE